MTEKAVEYSDDGVVGGVEPAVEGGARDPCLGHDRLDVETRRSFMLEQLRGRIEDGLALSVPGLDHGTTLRRRPGP